ncbi:hypothetical protein ACFT0G_15905 [Streptomyces sp. NPDC057020]|uniref:hypothetical protein n=1 Tax=unclassified Streptomyces TaxID=2593676 RepID=UPI003630C88E
MSSEETGTEAVVPAADGGTETESGTEAGTETGTDVTEALTGSDADAAKAVSTAPDGIDTDEVGTGAVASETVEVQEVVDVVEIPKQQSAEAAADNEAGEGARQ